MKGIPMADTTQSHENLPSLFSRIDKAWLAIIVIPLLVLVLDAAQFWPTLVFAGNAIAHTGLFIAFAVLAIGYLKATGAEAIVAKAFIGKEVRMIFLAALLGGLSPFCSCEVIPFIAALLVAGAPLSAVMAFWLASPLMDPAMFAITSGTLGFDFAIAKTVAAVSIGLIGGGIVMAFARGPVFANPLRETTATSSCGCGSNPFTGKPEWAFWNDADRRGVFVKTVFDNAIFLLKWLLLAYLIEALMIHYVPAEWIATFLGGEGLQPILLGALVGAPAYLNGYAAVPLVDALLTQGMAAGAAMSFVIAGGVSCIPAAIAVWALVKPRVFIAYLGIAMLGATLAGIGWSMIA